MLQLIAVTSLATTLTGCDSLEPYERAHSWHPIGTNASNLAAMAADPSDLARGRGTDATNGQAAAAAVDRLRRDHVKPLSVGSGAEPGVGTGPTAN